MATLALDALGSIYLTGTFGSTVDIDPGAGVDYRASVGAASSLLVKLNTYGSYAWGRIVGGAGITVLAVDPLRNIYLAGEFTGTVDFDPGTLYITGWGGSINYEARPLACALFAAYSLTTRTWFSRWTAPCT